MAASIIPVDDFDMVVFGATGDLTLRKLLPALFAPVPGRPVFAGVPDHRRGTLATLTTRLPRAGREGVAPSM